MFQLFSCIRCNNNSKKFHKGEFFLKNQSKFVFDAPSLTAFRHQAARIFDALAWCFPLKSGHRPDWPFQGHFRHIATNTAQSPPSVRLEDARRGKCPIGLFDAISAGQPKQGRVSANICLEEVGGVEDPTLLRNTMQVGRRPTQLGAWQCERLVPRRGTSRQPLIVPLDSRQFNHTFILIFK